MPTTLQSCALFRVPSLFFFLNARLSKHPYLVTLAAGSHFTCCGEVRGKGSGGGGKCFSFFFRGTTLPSVGSVCLHRMKGEGDEGEGDEGERAGKVGLVIEQHPAWMTHDKAITCQ